MEKSVQKDRLLQALLFAGGIAVGLAAAYFAGKRGKGPSETELFEKSLGKNFSLEEEKDKENLEKLMREQLVRNYQFFGEEPQNKVRNSFVVVVGCGGVGR